VPSRSWSAAALAPRESGQDGCHLASIIARLRWLRCGGSATRDIALTYDARAKYRAEAAPAAAAVPGEASSPAPACSWPRGSPLEKWNSSNWIQPSSSSIAST